MSLITDADHALDSAHTHIQEAVKELGKVLVDRCYGHDQYTPEFKSQIWRAFVELCELQSKLDEKL